MNPTMVRQTLAPEERKELLYAYAGHIFAAKGFSGTKIADIANAANVSQGLLYRYFDSKEALFTELIRNSLQKLNAAATALNASPPTVAEAPLILWACCSTCWASPAAA